MTPANGAEPVNKDLTPNRTSHWQLNPSIHPLTSPKSSGPHNIMMQKTRAAIIIRVLPIYPAWKCGCLAKCGESPRHELVSAQG
jgi:hypothetical protein